MSHRKTSGAVAVALAIALLITGTLAWFSGQSYTNTFNAESEAKYNVLLVDDFVLDQDRITDWNEGDTIPKVVYVTYDCQDQYWEDDDTHYAHHSDDGVDACDCPNQMPVWVRVNFVENWEIIDDSGPRNDGSKTYTGNELSKVTWTLNDADIVKIADWDGEQGDFWILDEDGWFYYATPLAHGVKAPDIMQAVTLNSLNEGETFKYWIDVNMEAIDRGLRDFESWTPSSIPSANGIVTDKIYPLFFDIPVTNQLGKTVMRVSTENKRVGIGGAEYVDLGNGIQYYLDEGVVKFGNYAYEEDGTPKEVDWLILDYDKDSGNLLLIAKNGVEAVRWNPQGAGNNYATSNLRNWLNSTGTIAPNLLGQATTNAPDPIARDGNAAGFLNTAFTADEKAKIVAVPNATDGNAMAWNGSTWAANHAQSRLNPVPAGDLVFALSRAEVWTYFGPNTVGTDADVAPHQISTYTNGMTIPTPYARATGAHLNQSTGGQYYVGHTHWWLRSAGNAVDRASYVHSRGHVFVHYGVHYTHIAARPALWVNLNS